MRPVKASFFRLSLTSLLGFTAAGCAVSDDSGGVDEIGDEFSTAEAAGDDLDGGGTGTSDGSTAGEEGSTSGADSGDTGDEGLDESSGESSGESTDTTTETGEPACNDIDDVILYLSPDDSNSTSSPAQVKDRVLDDGDADLGGIPIRVWEFMNYYGFAYEPAEDGSLATYAAMQPMDGFDARYRMQLAVASELMTPDERPPLNLTLVMDTSGSMGGEAIILLRETGKVIAAQLQAGDKVSMVEWNTENTWTLAGYEVIGPNDPQLIAKINELEAGGGTDLNGGLLSGYELAQLTFDPNSLNRLVLISDGGANAGTVEPGLIAQNAVYGGADGIYLVGVGVRSSSVSYNDALMDEVTDLGKGASLFIDSTAEAQKMFGEQFLSTMAIAAREVQVELTMPPGFEIVKFSGEEFSANPEEIEPQHIAPNDAIVFHQQVETCAPELVTDDAAISVKLTWQDVWTFQPRELVQSFSFAELLATEPSLLLKGAAVLAFAEGLKDYQKATTPDEKLLALTAANDAAAAALVALPDDADLAEIAAILAELTL